MLNLRPARRDESQLYPVSTMTDLNKLASDINAALPNVKSGPMRLWGESLGRPGEDGHPLIGCEANGDCLRVLFTEDEVLTVWNPRDVEIGPARFRIGSADAMRFTYYWWNRPRTPENIFYRDYALHEGLIVFRSNEDRVPGSGWMPDETTRSHPAVEISD
jgi:hypothetical protein